MDYLKAELKDRHVRRLRKGKCTIELGFVLTDLITNYERVADHCSNIAVCLIQRKSSIFLILAVQNTITAFVSIVKALL